MDQPASKVVGTAVKRPPNAGKGRKKGVPNRNTAIIKDMIVQALDAAGGVAYLVDQAERNPKAFLSLVGRVVPMQVTGGEGGPVEITITRRIVGE